MCVCEKEREREDGLLSILFVRIVVILFIVSGNICSKIQEI